MKELLNTINNIKNNGVSTLVNIFTKKDENKIINKVLNTDKFKKIYKDIDKEKAINIFKSNFILLAAKEDNKNFNRDFIVYDNGGSKEVFLYFEGSRARKWSIEGELIEIKADTEQQQGKEEEEKENKNIDILIKDIKESIKKDTYQITLQNGHLKLLHSNTAYSSNFNLLEYNLNTELTEEQREYIEKEIDFYIYSYNFDNIDILKNEIFKKYNISAEKENYKTLSIKTSDNLIKIIYNYDVRGENIFTIIIKNAVNKEHKEKSKSCVFSILDEVLKTGDVEPIKEEFYNNNEVEEGKEMQSKEIKELEKKYNVDIKFREFRGKLMYSVFYSPLKNNVTGIFKDIKQLEKQCKSIIIDNRINLTNKINKLENEYLRNI